MKSNDVKWLKIESDNSDEFNEFIESIDGFDRSHFFVIGINEDNGKSCVLYHNSDEDEYSPYYWGIYLSDGNGSCCALLQEAKDIASRLLK